MRRLALIALSAVLLLGLTGAGQAPPPAKPDFSAADIAALGRISAALNAIHTLTGGFIQIGPNGEVDQGKFYLEKPGKVRFEYFSPNPVLVVSDGDTVAVQNKKLNTVRRYPLTNTPFDIILSNDIDLAHNSNVMGVKREPGAITVEARTSNNRHSPNLDLVFAEPSLELRQWTIVDDQGLTTTVALSNLEPGAKIEPWLFDIPKGHKAVGTKSRD